jgi:hypothetical protein
MENASKLFTIDTILDNVQLVNNSLIAPYVNTTYSTLGGVTNISMMITISLDSKENWSNGILQNSRYAKFHLSNNGRLEMFAGNTPKKMRRSIVSSMEEAIKKINKYILSPEKYEDGGNVDGKQMSYPAASQSGFTLNTVVPASMYSELKVFNQFLRTFIETEYNMTVVQYVAQKLHYKSVEDLFYDEPNEKGERKGRFSVEQIDAIAIAIYNHEINGNSIIIADQTGVGKGRTAAGLIRYTILELQTLPIFVTEKKHLLIDIYRDLVDIGFDANIPQIRRTYLEIKKEEYTKDEIIKLIKEDFSENEDFRVEYPVPDSESKSWFTIDKFKSFPSRSKIKNDNEYELYENMYEELITLYEQKLLEEGYVKEVDTIVSQDEIDRLEEDAIKKGKMRVFPFVPSGIDIVADSDDVKVTNVIYPKMKDAEIKEIYGYTKNEKGKLVYDFENPPIDRIQLPNKFKLIALPYSQLNQLEVKDDAGRMVVSPKLRFYEKVVGGKIPNGEIKPAVLILDEAHNAAGGSGTFKVLCKLIELAKMTTFLSATFAKRPDNMPLYAKGTSLKESGLSDTEMINVFTRGDVALQEAVSAELTRNGQILRREKQIQGKTDYFYVYDDKKEYGGKQLGTQQRVRLDSVADLFDKRTRDSSQTMATIMGFQRKISTFITDYKRELPSREDNGDRLVGSKDEVNKARTIKALAFNLFNYFLIGNKLDQLEYAMTEKMTNGRKLVITIANTLESILKDMPKNYFTNKDDDKYKVGEMIPNDFNRILAYMLFYTMRIKISREVVDIETQTVSIKEETICVFDSTHDLARSIVAEFRKEYIELLNKILNTKTYVPIAPIDVIKTKINGYVDADGYTHTIEEITGRSLMLTFKKKKDENGKELNEFDFSQGEITQRSKRPTTEVVRDFNSNVIDHLIINKSGATGISMHPRTVGQAQIVYKTTIVEEINEDGNKQELEIGFPLKLENKEEVKKRCMLILQMELDINSEVQKLGRISRTGQVYRPEYTYIVSSIPSESRLTAMMEKKLRSLSANVSSNQEQASDLFSADDFFSSVAVQPFSETLQDMNESIDGDINKEAIKEYTKTLYFKQFEFQRDFYTTFARKLKAHIEYLTELGEYTGKMTIKDYKATDVKKYPFYIGNENSKTSFGRHATISKVQADIPIKKTNETDIGQIIDIMIGSENNYGGEYLKFESIDEYKEQVSSRIESYANRKIEAEQSKIDYNKGEIISYESIIKDYSSELKLIVENGEQLIMLLQEIKDKQIELDEAEVPYKKAIADEDFEEAGKLKAKVTFKRDEVNKLKSELTKYDSLIQGDSEITEEILTRKRENLESRISRNQRYIEESNKSIKSYEENISYYNDLMSNVVSMIRSVGGVFQYTNLIEEERYEDDGYTISAYDYSLGESSAAVITGVFVSSSNFTPSNIDVRISTLTNSFRIPFSKIFPMLSEREKELNKKATNSFSFINKTYIKYWDNEILKKTPGTRREERWIVGGNILRGFKGVIDIGLMPLITKYTTLDRKEKLGIEIKNISEAPPSMVTTYSTLENTYESEYTILFDANVQNFVSFVQGYLYDKYVGDYYNAHRDSNIELKSKKSNDNVVEKNYFQIATIQSGLTMIVVVASKELIDYSNGLKNALEIGRMEDVSEMLEEEFISKLSVEMVSERNMITDYFAMSLESTGYNDYQYETTRPSRAFPNAQVVMNDNLDAGYVGLYYYINFIPVNKEQITSITNVNGGRLRGSFNKIKNVPFENFLNSIEFLDSQNAKPTLGVSSKYYEKYSSLYMLDDNLEEKITTTENLPTDAENEISKMIFQLIEIL